MQWYNNICGGGIHPKSFIDTGTCHPHVSAHNCHYPRNSWWGSSGQFSSPLNKHFIPIGFHFILHLVLIFIWKKSLVFTLLSEPELLVSDSNVLSLSYYDLFSQKQSLVILKFILPDWEDTRLPYFSSSVSVWNEISSSSLIWRLFWAPLVTVV